MGRSPQICREPGCPRFRPCAEHPEPDRRSPSSRTTGTRAFRKIAQRVLRRDGHRCQLRYDCCLVHATTADHVIPVSRGGTDAMGNLQAACAPCNNRKNGR